MDRGSRNPSGALRKNVGIPCPIQRSGARETGVQSRTGNIRAPGSRLPAPGGVPRPQGIPGSSIRRPSAIPETGPRLGGVNTVSRMPASGHISGAAGVPIPDNTLTSGRMPRPCIRNEVAGAQRHGLTGVGVPRPSVPVRSSMPRPCAVPGPSTSGRPNIVPGASGLPRGARIPRPGGTVTASTGMSGTNIATQAGGIVRPSYSSGVGSTPRTGGIQVTGVPGTSIATQAGAIVRPSSISGVGSVPRTVGIPGAAGIARPVYSMAAPRPCIPRANVIPGPGGESRETTMVTPRSYTRPPVLPGSRAGPAQVASMRPAVMPQPGARPRLIAPGSFVRPPFMQRPVGIPRPGLPRPQFSTGQPLMPRKVCPNDVTGTGVMASNMGQQTIPVCGGLGPQEQTMLTVGDDVPLQAFPSACYQYQQSPCSPANIPPRDAHFSPGAGGGFVEEAYVEDESRVTSPIQASRVSPVVAMDGIDRTFPTGDSSLLEPSHTQRSISPCPRQERSPVRNTQSPSPRRAHEEVTYPCRNLSPSSRQQQSPAPCPKPPSPPAPPTEEYLSPIQSHSPPRRSDTSRVMSSTSPLKKSPCMRPMTRKRLRRERHESARYSRLSLTSPRTQVEPADERIEYRMPATPASVSSHTPMTSPSPPDFPSPNRPCFTPTSSPREAEYAPYSAGRDLAGFDAEGDQGSVTMERSYDSGSPRGVPPQLLTSDRSEWEEEDGSFCTPPTAGLRYQPSHYRPRKPLWAKVKREQVTPLSRVPIKDLSILHGRGERIYPLGHWRRLTDIYEEKGDSIEESAAPAVYSLRGPSLDQPASPEEDPCSTMPEPPECPPDAWSAEESEFTQEVDTGDGRSTKSKTKVRKVTKQWNDPSIKYSTSTKNKETVEILLSPPAGGGAAPGFPGEGEGPCQEVPGEDAASLVQVADECHRMAEEAAARAQLAAEQASRMALEAERAASRCSDVGGEEEERASEIKATESELEQMCRLLEEEEQEVDAAVALERKEYEERKMEFAEEERKAAAHGRRPTAPCPRAAGEDSADRDQGPSSEVLAAMMWAEECGAPLSSDPEKLFQLLFGQSASRGGGEEDGESVLEERALAGPDKLSRAQLRGSSEPLWFSGYHCAFPPCVDVGGRRDGVMVAAKSPSRVLYSAWLTMAPESFTTVC